VNRRYRTYTAYSIGVGIVWAVRLALVSIIDSGRRRTNFLVFFGFALGWLSATIARAIYPPPKKYRAAVDQTP
jgi:hypothetical protein